MNYESTFSVQSDVAPGVVYFLRKATATRRAALLLATSEVRARVRQLLAEVKAISAQPEDQRDNEQVDALVKSVQAQVTTGNVLYLQWGLHKVSGLDIDGQPPDANTFIFQGPDSLVAEALAMVQEIAAGTDAPAAAPQHTAASSPLVQ